MLGVLEKLKVLITRGEEAFSFPFSNNESYSMRNICAYSKREIKTKVTIGS